MRVFDTSERLGNLARRYVAGAAIRLAIFMLRRSHQLYRAGIFDLAAAKQTICWSDQVASFALGVVKRKRRS